MRCQFRVEKSSRYDDQEEIARLQLMKNVLLIKSKSDMVEQFSRSNFVRFTDLVDAQLKAKQEAEMRAKLAAEREAAGLLGRLFV